MYPILFQIGPFTVGSYGASVLLAVAVGWLILPRYARRAGIDPALGRRFLLAVFVAGAVGCRLLQVLFRLPEVIQDPQIGFWMIRQAGVWYGAIGGGLLAGIILARLWKIPFWPVLDMAAVPAALGGGIGRIGCLMSGCCFGTPTQLPWGIAYTNEMAHRLHPDLPYGSLHPAPVYELLVAVVLALVLDRYGGRNRIPGQTGLLWIFLYSGARIVLELFRGDAIRGSIYGLMSTSQAISLVAGCTAAVLWVIRGRRHAATEGRGDA